MLESLIPHSKLGPLIQRWLEEDCPNYDVAGAIVSGKRAKAKILGKASGVLCGKPFVTRIFEELGCSISWMAEEGECFEPIKLIAEIEGEASSILLGERLALNLLARASAIATK